MKSRARRLRRQRRKARDAYNAFRRVALQDLLQRCTLLPDNRIQTAWVEGTVRRMLAKGLITRA